MAFFRPLGSSLPSRPSSPVLPEPKESSSSGDRDKTEPKGSCSSGDREKTELEESSSSGALEKTEPNRQVFQTIILAVLIALLGTAAAACLFTIFLPWMLLTTVAAKILRPDLGPLIRDMSAAFAVNPQDDCVASLVHYIILDDTITSTRFIELFDERVIRHTRPNGQLMFPRCRDGWTEFGGYTFWRPEVGFSTAAHIRDYDLKGELALPEPSCDREALRRIMGGVTGLRWRRHKSPWEALLIHNYRDDDLPRPRTVILIRHHHALIDGYGIVTLIRSLFKCQYSLPPLSFPQPRLWSRLLAPLKVPYDLATMLLESADGLTNWHVHPTVARTFHVSMSGRIPTGTVRAIKDKLGVSYSAVLFAVIAGSIQRLLRQEKMDVPEHLGVFAPLPKRNHPGGTANHILLVGMRWKIKCESSLQRLFAIQDTLVRLQSSTVPLVGDWTSGVIGVLPTSLRRFLLHKFIGGGSAVISSFPATPDAVSLDGIPIRDIISTVGSIGQLSMTILITGVSGNQHVTIAGNRTVFPFPGFRNLGIYIEEELQNLWNSPDSAPPMQSRRA